MTGTILPFPSFFPSEKQNLLKCLEKAEKLADSFSIFINYNYDLNN